MHVCQTHSHKKTCTYEYMVFLCECVCLPVCQHACPSVSISLPLVLCHRSFHEQKREQRRRSATEVSTSAPKRQLLWVVPFTFRVQQTLETKFTETLGFHVDPSNGTRVLHIVCLLFYYCLFVFTLCGPTTY